MPVAVQDVGIGTEPEGLDRLFAVLYTAKPDGMGMGLSICRSIVEAHGGWHPHVGHGFHRVPPDRARILSRQRIEGVAPVMHKLRCGALLFIAT